MQMKYGSWLLFTAAAMLTLPALATGNTWIVAQDGSGDFTTINAALAASANQDSIVVGPGTYSEALVVSKQLILVSSHGPTATQLDANYGFELVRYVSGGGGQLSGFTLRRADVGPAGEGGAVRVNYCSGLLISDCVFEDNWADYQGGGLALGNGSVVEVVDCSFLENYAPVHCGAAVAIQGSHLSFTRCRFIGNRTAVYSGAIAAHSSILDVQDCLFLRNLTNDVSGAIYLFASSGQIRNNTFHENRSPGRATVVIHQSGAAVIERNIFSGDTAGYGLQFYEGGGGHACNLYWNNDEGALSGASLAPDELIADPLFCSANSDHFELYDISPGAPAHSPCGLLIGAFPVACSTTGVESTSFSAIKALY